MFCIMLFCGGVLLLAPQESVPAQNELQTLIEQAEAKAIEQRIDAVLKVGAMIPKLNDELRLEAAFGLLIDKTVDRSSLVNSAAQMRLAEHGVAASKYLKPYVQSEKFIEFAKGCEAIKAIGAPSKIWLTDLLKRLRRDDRQNKLGALHALAALDGQDLLPVLDDTIAALDSKDFNVQLSACRVLSKIGPAAKKAGRRLVRLTEEGIVSARSWASIALGAIGPHPDYDVVAILSKKLGMFYVTDRERALVGLAFLGPEAKSVLPKVKVLMKNREKSVQHVAARTYWKISGDAETAVATLVRLFPTPEFGADAIDIVAEMGAEADSAVPALREQLKSPEAPSREAAVYALGSIGAPAKAALEDLESLKDDPDTLIRAAVIHSIDLIHEAQLKSSELKNKEDRP